MEADLTIENIRQMQAGDATAISKWLPYMLIIMEADIFNKPFREAQAKRWEDFKRKVADRHIVEDGNGI